MHLGKNSSPPSLAQSSIGCLLPDKGQGKDYIFGGSLNQISHFQAIVSFILDFTSKEHFFWLKCPSTVLALVMEWLKIR